MNSILNSDSFNSVVFSDSHSRTLWWGATLLVEGWSIFFQKLKSDLGVAKQALELRAREFAETEMINQAG